VRRTILTVAAVAVLVAATGAAIAMAGGAAAKPVQSGTSTATVTRGPLSSLVSLDGTLTYRAQSDGSPYTVINRARGIYTALPATGERVGCGGALYRVDDRPVLLLCGAVPAYRDLSLGVTGADVRQLNKNLRALGYDIADSATFGAATQTALRKLQRDRGCVVTGRLALTDAVFLPDAVRIADVTGRLGGGAQPDADVLHATSDTLVVQVNLEPWQQGEVAAGDAARITLPGNASATGKVDRLGTVAVVPAGQGGNAADASVPAFLTLDDPSRANGLDRAPVSVDITTTGVPDALSVPVTALLGNTGGGYAVEVVRDGAPGALVAVTLGLFDATAGRVQVDGALHEGDHVVVPSS
jgi:peptidoglycan hydrolase-like protein with peptidoglycan-binding domain